MTAPSTGAVGDARKRDQWTHHDPAVRALIAEAVQVERERIAAAIESTRAVLAYRERELLELKGPCSSCRLHYAHSGPCDTRIARDGGR